MQNQLYIPKKIKVGFQHREDTYTKKLGYVIYYDDKGVLRKEKSWTGWCHKEGQEIVSWSWNPTTKEHAQVKTKFGADFAPLEIDNIPHSGFHLNKGVQRNGSWGGGRSMCRIYDDRGFEFEITIDNLMFILMGSDCLKRGLEGEYVYSWSGNNLILLPVNSEEYKNSTKFTALQGKTIGVADLIPGCSYKTKRQQDIIYLGKFNWFEPDSSHNASMLNEHVFYSEKGGMGHYCNNNKCKFFHLVKLDTLATQTTTEAVSNYAQLVDDFYNSSHGSKIESFQAENTDVYFQKTNGYHYHRNSSGGEIKEILNGVYYTDLGTGKFQANHIYEVQERKEGIHHWDLPTFKPSGYRLVPFKTVILNGTDIAIKSCSKKDTKLYTKDEIKGMKFHKLCVSLSSGKKYKLAV